MSKELFWNDIIFWSICKFTFCKKYLYSSFDIICVLKWLPVSKKKHESSGNFSQLWMFYFKSRERFLEIFLVLLTTVRWIWPTKILFFFFGICTIWCIQKNSCVNRIKVSADNVLTIANIYWVVTMGQILLQVFYAY